MKAVFECGDVGRPILILCQIKVTNDDVKSKLNLNKISII